MVAYDYYYMVVYKSYTSACTLVTDFDVENFRMYSVSIYIYLCVLFKLAGVCVCVCACVRACVRTC